MSKEMLPTKFGGEQGLGPDSPPIVIENKKKRREGRILVLYIAVGVGILALTTIILLPHVNSFGAKIFGGLSSSTDSQNGAIVPTADLTSSFFAADASGNLIGISEGVARSEQVTISGYSDSTYSTKLQCSIDALPLYCDGSPVVLPGLPLGKHTFATLEPSSSEITIRVFRWETIP
jgi:hypothetical protein